MTYTQVITFKLNKEEYRIIKKLLNEYRDNKNVNFSYIVKAGLDKIIKEYYRISTDKEDLIQYLKCVDDVRQDFWKSNYFNFGSKVASIKIDDYKLKNIEQFQKFGLSRSTILRASLYSYICSFLEKTENKIMHNEEVIPVYLVCDILYNQCSKTLTNTAQNCIDTPRLKICD